MKKDAWLKIENEFNYQSSENHRTASVLKNKYDNIKRNVKKQYADEKTFSRETGGGPAKPYPHTFITTSVEELLMNKMHESHQFMILITGIMHQRLNKTLAALVKMRMDKLLQ